MEQGFLKKLQGAEQRIQELKDELAQAQQAAAEAEAELADIPVKEKLINDQKEKIETLERELSEARAEL